MQNSIRDFPLSLEVRHDRASTLARSNPAAALEEARKLIDDGFCHAHSLAGFICEGSGDFRSALFYYQQGSAMCGAVESWLGIARLNFRGNGLERNYSEAYRCYKAVSEDSDHIVAWLMLGIMYRHGFGIEKNVAKARECLERAARKGSVFAYREMAEVDKECGKFFSSLLNRVRAGFYAFRIVSKDDADIRLRIDE